MSNTKYSGEQYPGKVYAADVRYGDTFLDVDFLDKSVPGEVMKDNLSGELFLRRVIDGKVVSFAQKSISIFEFLNEFNLQMQSSFGYVYPKESGSYLLGVRFNADLMATHSRENHVNIYEDNLTFNKDIIQDYNFVFGVSPKTNGVFIKPLLRHGDRISAGWLTGRFSEDELVNFASVSRSFKDFLIMNLEYKDAHLYDVWKVIDDWKSSNAMVDYTVVTTGTNSSGVAVSTTVKGTSVLRLNEQSYVQFPDGYDEGMVNIQRVQVEVNKIYFPKLQYEYHMCKTSRSSTGLTNPLAQIIEADLRACIRSIEIYYFISSSSEIPVGENRVIHQCIDYDMFEDAIDTLLTASGTRSVQSSIERPKVFGIDSIWAEELREVQSGGGSIPNNTENSIEELEKAIYIGDPEIFTQFTQNRNDAEDVLIVRKG